MSNWKNLIKNESKDIKITFVCTGNIIRSAYAEYMAKKYFKLKNKPNLKFDSGACFHQNSYIYPLTKKLLLNEGIPEVEILSHKPRLIENYFGDFKRTTLFIAMTKQHLEYLDRQFPGSSFLLKDIVENRKEDVLDPYYYPNKEEEIMNELKSLIIRFCEELEKLI
jgi:protein-tyrosine-phosphatase